MSWSCILDRSRKFLSSRSGSTTLSVPGTYIGSAYLNCHVLCQQLPPHTSLPASPGRILGQHVRDLQPGVLRRILLQLTPADDVLLRPVKVQEDDPTELACRQRSGHGPLNGGQDAQHRRNSRAGRQQVDSDMGDLTAGENGG